MGNREMPAQPARGKSGRFVRKPIKIAFFDASIADERYGGSGDIVVIEGDVLKPESASSSTIVVFMHPSAIMNLLPLPAALAKAGIHVCTCTSRYPNNDSCCIMENAVNDLGACIRHLKQKLGYQRVILGGWSGGGSLSSFYQAQAENATVKQTPAGDKIDLSTLISADGLMILAAHTSRAKIFTEWLDPAVMSESDPQIRDPDLDLWNPRNAPPYTKEFVERYRHAQVARNRRITSWAKERLAALEKENLAAPWKQGRRDQPFIVRCTQADLRRVDTTLDPNERSPVSLRALAAENHSPVGLARFTTLRSWLSQWSYDDSNADGPTSLASVTVPVLVLANGGDHLVPVTHSLAMFDAVRHKNKQYSLIRGATHYYFGPDQKDKKLEAVQIVKTWMSKQGFLD